MYEYKFVKVELGGWTLKPKEDYQEIVHEHAREGWRLAHMFAPPVYGHGCAKYIELVFEREVR